MVNLNNYPLVDVKLALVAARKEVAKLEQMLAEDGYDFNRFTKQTIAFELNQLVHTTNGLNAYLNSKQS